MARYLRAMEVRPSNLVLLVVRGAVALPWRHARIEDRGCDEWAIVARNGGVPSKDQTHPRM